MPTTNAAEVFKDLASYPILTQRPEEVAGSRTGAPAGIGRTAEDTLRAVLGWRYRADDLKGFEAALSAAATVRNQDGQTLVTWRAPTFMIQADLGEITGAQASLLARTKAAIEQILPLLDALAPLRPDVDEEDVAGIRALVRAQLAVLGEEYGRLGGPRVPRVDGSFTLLLGAKALDHDFIGLSDFGDEIEGVAGHTRSPAVTRADCHLGQLKRRLGLDQERVNTVIEERILTDFLTISDTVMSLRDAWMRNRKNFLGIGGEAYLGTDLVRLARYLDVVVESVRECYAAMDSVFFGPAERQAFALTFAIDSQPQVLTVADLLSWIEGFAATEARQLVQDAGKDGVASVRHTLEHLRDLAAGMLELARDEEGDTCCGFFSVRSVRALCELASYLAQAVGPARLPRVEVLAAASRNQIELSRPLNVVAVDTGAPEATVSVIRQRPKDADAKIDPKNKKK